MPYISKRAWQDPLPHRFWVIMTVLGVALATLTFGDFLPGVPTGAARAAEYTAAANNLRDGWDSQEGGLSPARVASGGFGRLFSTSINGQVYAQPLVVGNTVIVATENNWVYGINATSGHINWSRQLGAPWPAAAEHCTDLQPNVGITSTPVYDPAKKLIYLVDETVPQGNTSSDPVFNLVEMNPANGAVARQVPIVGQVTNGSNSNPKPLPFHPFDQLQRAGLLLMNGTVYAAFSGHCDFTPYEGYVAAVKVSGGASFWTDETNPTNTQSGIWAAGSGLMSDGSGRIFLATGNSSQTPGSYPAQGPGANPPGALGNSVVRLAVNGDGSLSTKDFFSPADAGKLNLDDTDLGSGGPIGLPFGTKAYPKLLAEAGKEGMLYLLNRDSLGGRMQGPGGTDAVAAEKSVTGTFRDEGQYGRSAAFGGTASIPNNTSKTSDYLYYVGNDYAPPSYNGPMRIFRIGANASGKPTISDVANTSVKFGYLSAGSPVVTSSGGNPASAVVWLIGMGSPSGVNGRLYAFRAAPSQSCTQAHQCTEGPLRSWPLGTATKFSVPAISGGRVYVATRDGHLLAFGNPSTTPVRVSGTGFPKTTVGHTTVSTVTLTAARTTVVTRISTANAFRVLSVRYPNGATARFPVRLTGGQQLKVRVAFRPTSPGGAGGSMTIATRDANFPAVTVGLNGTGIRTGFYAAPGGVNFGNVPDGLKGYATVRVINGGTSTEKVTIRHSPSGPFSIKGWPGYGASIGAGKAIVLKVTYAPNAVAGNSTSFTIGGPAGTSATVHLAGTGIAARSGMSSSAGTVSFGSVAQGQQPEQTITITNTGNLPATIGSVTQPGSGFGAPSPDFTGQHLNPGGMVRVPLTFTPVGTGNASSAYVFRWSDVAGQHTLTVPLTGTGTAPASGIAVPQPDNGWQLNGSASISGTSLQLTPGANEAASAIYPTPVTLDGLNVTFQTQFTGQGDYGLSFALLNPALPDTYVGSPGALLGFDSPSLTSAGLEGLNTAVALVTGDNANEYPEYVGVADGMQAGNATALGYWSQAGGIPELRTGSHTVNIKVALVAGSTNDYLMTISLDGAPVIYQDMTNAGVFSQGGTALLAFTAGTAGHPDTHIVSNVAISAKG